MEYADGIRRMTGIELVKGSSPKSAFTAWWRNYSKRHPDQAAGWKRGGVALMAWSDYPNIGHQLAFEGQGAHEWSMVLIKDVGAGHGTFAEGRVIDFHDPRVISDIAREPTKMPRDRKLRDYAFAIPAICRRCPEGLEEIPRPFWPSPNGIGIRIDGETRHVLWTDLDRIGWDMCTLN